MSMTLAAVASPTLASAQSATDRALAQSLFDEGRRLMGEGKYVEACPKLAESQRLDPGGGTLMNLALCHEKEGKTASAWSEFNEALSQSVKDGRAEREASAREHIAALEGKLTRIVLDVPTAARVEGLSVKIDGVTVGQAGWGSATPVDPGQHVIEATATFRKPWSQRVEGGPPGSPTRVNVPVLEDDPDARARAEEEKARLARGGGSIAGPVAPPDDSSRRTAGFVVGGVGVAALAVGAVFGVSAISKRKDSDKECPSDHCTPKGVELNDQAMTSAWIANVGVGLGLVGVGIGTYLILSGGSSSPSGSASTASVRVVPVTFDRNASGGLAVTGSFH